METLDQTLSRHDDTAAARKNTSARLILVLESDRVTERSRVSDLAGIDLVTIGRGASRAAERAGGDLTIRVPDRRISSVHAKLRHLQGSWIAEDGGSKNGTLINGKKLERAVLADGDLLEVGHTFFLFRDHQPGWDLPADVEADQLQPPQAVLATFVPELRQRFANLARVAASDVPVLIHGETGTGKEVIANAVHRLSARGGRFVAVNCGGIPRDLVEAELFGAVRGAFSGADSDRLGLVRAADKGTLLLDEVGDLPLGSQAALLRVLQEREVLPVGATEPIGVDFRLVAATHRDLHQLVAEERFRGDLLARMSGLTMTLPPLRERREDIGILIASLIEKILGTDASAVTFSPGAARALLTYDWPYNVRELHKCLSTAAVLADSGVIGREQLPEAIRNPSIAPREAAPALEGEDAAHRDEIVALLERHGGNVSAVARETGKARVQVHRWLKRYGIEPADYR